MLHDAKRHQFLPLQRQMRLVRTALITCTETAFVRSPLTRKRRADFPFFENERLVAPTTPTPFSSRANRVGPQTHLDENGSNSGRTSFWLLEGDTTSGLADRAHVTDSFAKVAVCRFPFDH